MEYNIAENIGLIPTAVQPEQLDAETERKLTTDITDLWSVHVQAQNTVATTKEELKVIRQNLGERLHEMKQLLARPGRNGQWSSFLQEHGIPRTTGDRLIAGHLRSVAPETNCPSDAIHAPTTEDIEKLFKSRRPKLARILTTRESVYGFILCLISRASLPHERRDEGILIFHPTVAAPKDVPPAKPSNGNHGDIL
jgi:hypothetical protein